MENENDILDTDIDEDAVDEELEADETDTDGAEEAEDPEDPEPTEQPEDAENEPEGFNIDDLEYDENGDIIIPDETAEEASSETVEEKEKEEEPARDPKDDEIDALKNELAALKSQSLDTLKKLGVKVETNVVIGKTLTVDELFGMGFEAVFIGSGAGLPNFMGIPGESYKGVYSANEFLTRSNLMKAYLDNPETPIMKGGKVAVVGGGNVAMDAARTALRLGAEKVYIVYRRSMEELPARKEEVEHAEEEGIEFRLLCNPTEILGYNNPEDPRDPKNGFVTGMKCVKMELGEPDAKGRRRPVVIPDSEFEIEVDTVVISIGTSPNPLIKSTTEGLEVNAHGGIIVNEDGLSSRNAVYAGGDVVTGAATVISAMGAGKTAAKAIDEYLSK